MYFPTGTWRQIRPRRRVPLAPVEYVPIRKHKNQLRNWNFFSASISWRASLEGYLIMKKWDAVRVLPQTRKNRPAHVIEGQLYSVSKTFEITVAISQQILLLSRHLSFKLSSKKKNEKTRQKIQLQTLCIYNSTRASHYIKVSPRLTILSRRERRGGAALNSRKIKLICRRYKIKSAVNESRTRLIFYSKIFENPTWFFNDLWWHRLEGSTRRSKIKNVYAVRIRLARVRCKANFRAPTFVPNSLGKTLEKKCRLFIIPTVVFVDFTD